MFIFSNEGNEFKEKQCLMNFKQWQLFLFCVDFDVFLFNEYYQPVDLNYFKMIF